MTDDSQRRNKMVKIRTLPGGEVKEVTFEEAREIFERTYNSPGGGLVVDGKTKEALYQLNPDVDEIIIIEEMLGGG